MKTIPELSEPELVEYLFKTVHLYSNAFYFIEKASIGDSRADWDFHYHLCVMRDELGLELGKKPGDIDVLVIPHLDGDPFAERAVGVEVKKFNVPNTKRSKGPNKYGISQARGIIEDGFPFGCLLHIPIIQPSEREDWYMVEHMSNRLENGEPKIVGQVETDLAAIGVQARHIGRIPAFNLHSEVGFHTLSLDLNADCNQVIGWTVDPWISAKKNTLRNPKLVETIRSFERQPDFIVSHRRTGLEIKKMFRA